MHEAIRQHLCYTLLQTRDIRYEFRAPRDDVWPQHAVVRLRLQPGARESRLAFHHFPAARFDHPTQRLPRWAVDAVEQGCLHAFMVGGPGGIPVTDLRVELTAGICDPRATHERGFFLAAYYGVRQVLTDAWQLRRKPRGAIGCLLEHVDHVVATVPGGKLRALRETLTQREAAAIQIPEAAPDVAVVTADVPTRRLADFGGWIARARGTWERKSLGLQAVDPTAVLDLLETIGPPMDFPPKPYANPNVDLPPRHPLIGGDFPDFPEPDATLPRYPEYPGDVPTGGVEYIL